MTATLHALDLIDGAAPYISRRTSRCGASAEGSLLGNQRGLPRFRCGGKHITPGTVGSGVGVRQESFANLARR